MSLNKVQLIGRLGAEPESRSFPNGGSICTLRIATSESKHASIATLKVSRR